MKKILKATSILVVLFFVIANIAYAQPTTTTSTTTPTIQPATGGGAGGLSGGGGAGGIIPEPPGGGILDGAYTPEHLEKRKPIPYVYEREADIMWQRRIWRVIDLREKINHPLYYPIDSLAKRPALFQVIKNGIASGEITAVFDYDISTSEFGKGFTKEEIADALTYDLPMKDSLGQPLMDSTGNQIMKPSPMLPTDIAQYWIKEDWFFEKQRSVMDVRIIAIAPVKANDDPIQQKYGYEPLFWLYYPGIRNILARSYCYNPSNDAEWRTYDEIFHKRMFSSYVKMESNVYNRPIVAYLGGQSMEQLLEAERIKDDIFKMEHDMWNY